MLIRKLAHMSGLILLWFFPPMWITSNMDSIILSHLEFLGVLLKWPVKKQSTY